jgi:hypothetical protein
VIEYRLLETEAGDVLHEEWFGAETAREAEKHQAERWNEHYCMGEPRVLSRLYRKGDNKWELVMSMGADEEGDED